MAKLMLHRNLLKNFGKLPAKVQKKISEWIDLFQTDPYDPGIGLHALQETMIDPKVRGADLPGGYRAIIVAPEKGDTFLLVHIDTHDRAYDWAKNKRFEVHGATGVFQLFDVLEIESAAFQEPEHADSPLPTSPRWGEETNSPYPLSRLSDEDLFKAGVPKPLIPAVKAIHSDHALDALSDYLPTDCRDVLYGVASGMSIEKAVEEMLGLTPEQAASDAPDGAGDFSHIDRAPHVDLVLVEGEEHLRDILKASLDAWRIFLHPYQRKLVERQTRGPMHISGSAGTGKTVALMHRAVHLANNLKDARDKVLLTTFTTNLSIMIKNQVQKLDPKAANKIEVTNLHALARTVCLRSGWRGRIAADEEYSDIWEDIWMDPGLGELPLPREELKKEYFLVIDSNGIDEEDAYLTTVRSGRPRMDRKQRRAAWPIFRAFQRGLKKRNLLTFEGAVHQARLAIEQGHKEKYAHVLVDEIQDFSLEALRLIRALSPVDKDAPDPLCTAGDGHQRIYRTKIPLKRANINIQGRSWRLKINYRTSEQIRRFAMGIVNGMEIDDLDGGVAVTDGDHSAFKGPDPIIQHCDNEKNEAEAIVAWAKTLMADQGLATHEICVTPYKPEIRSALTTAGIATYQLKPREDDPGSDMPGIRLGTIKRIKGLEFRAVALACADKDDPMNQLTKAEAASRCERYVAATRAREHLLVTLAGAESTTPI